jgi:hypothetical protein
MGSLRDDGSIGIYRLEYLKVAAVHEQTRDNSM